MFEIPCDATKDVAIAIFSTGQVRVQIGDKGFYLTLKQALDLKDDLTKILGRWNP